MIDGETPANQVRGQEFENTDSLLIRIVRRVATASDCDVIDLEPRHRTIDFDALDTLVTASRTPHLKVSFRYEGYAVEIARPGCPIRGRRRRGAAAARAGAAALRARRGVRRRFRRFGADSSV